MKTEWEQEQKADKHLDRAIAELPRELMPERDLWLQLEPKLQARPAPARHWIRIRISQALAAAAVFAVAGILAWRVFLVPDEFGPLLTEFGSDREYVAAHQSLMEEFESIKAEKLSNVGRVSESFGDWHYQLAVWDQAIDQVREALVYYPNEPQLLSQMSGLYQQQLSYLQMVSVVDTNEYSWMGNEP